MTFAILTFKLHSLKLQNNKINKSWHSKMNRKTLKHCKKHLRPVVIGSSLNIINDMCVKQITW